MKTVHRMPYITLVKTLLLIALCHINILAESFDEKRILVAPKSWVASQKMKSLLIETQKKGAILLYDLEKDKFKDSKAAESALLNFFRNSRKKQLKIKDAIYGNNK